MQIIRYTDKYHDDWNEYAFNSSQATICHRIEWRTIISDGLSHKPYYLLAQNENNKVCGILPMFEVSTWWGKTYLISIPWLDYGGVIADNEEIEKTLLDSAEKIAIECKADFVELRSENATLKQTSKREDKVTFLLPLEEDEEAIWKSFDAKLRNQIRKSTKSGLTVEFGREELLDEFYPIFCRNMRDLGTPVWGKRLFKSTLRILPENSEIIIVRHEKKPIAGGLLLDFNGRYYVPSASSFRSMRTYCPNHALYWEAIKKGCQNGGKFFDFGRSTKNGPTFNFKKQWMPEPTQLTWQYSLLKGNDMPSINPDNRKYDMIIKIWQKLPLPIANLIGPRVIKNFP